MSGGTTIRLVAPHNETLGLTPDGDNGGAGREDSRPGGQGTDYFALLI
jgi:hypothetical protein